ncbi:MAG: class I SAM-dependent methyltransferase, partial [Patescibacteria group bacterium]|nr:class I SAM-dependent methyltransferase [Patescibacteria group bacterium]
WQQISRNIFVFNAFVMARYRQVVKQIPKTANLKILDIGCGDGVLLSLIKNATLYGIDLDKDGLGYAATNVKAKFIQAPADELPFKPNFFDVVLATEIIEHLDQPEKLIQEAKRVLKPSGYLILTTPVKQPGKLTDKLHVQEFSPTELRNLLRPHFQPITITQSHPLCLKKIYTLTLFKFGRFYFEPFKWLINFWVFLTGLNPFNLRLGQSSQLFALAKKYDR